MKSDATTVDEYLADLPDDRRSAIEAVRKVILKNLPRGYEEGMQYGMIGYFVPHSLYPAGYHCNPREPLPFASLASQKNYMAVYLMCIYSDADHDAWFREAWAQTGKKLDMGKSCIRFKKVDDLPLPLIGQAIKRVPVRQFVENYESVIKPAGKRGKTASQATASRKTAMKKSAVQNKSAKQTPVKKKSAIGKKRR